MKNYIVVSFLCLFTVALSSNELAWVDKQIDAIKPPRKGLSNSAVSNLRSPFIFLKKSEKSVKTASTRAPSSRVTKSSDATLTSRPKTQKKGLNVDAIMNKSAFINGAWYKINDRVQGYTIMNITPTSVVLTKNSKRFVLSTSSVNRNLKFKNK